MNIISVTFLCFCLIVILFYYCIPKCWQWCVVLGANLVFYVSFGFKSLAYILLTSVVVYYAAICVDDINYKMKADSVSADAEEKRRIRTEGTKKKKNLCLTAYIAIFGVWGVIKYAGFVIEMTNMLFLPWNGFDTLDIPAFLLPLGMSFYTFVVASYLIDVYRGKYAPELSFWKFFTFVTFFPHIIQGPFSRFDKLGKSLFQEHNYSYDRMCIGIRRMLWGLFKKIVIADVLAFPVDLIFSNSGRYPGIYVFIAAFGYAAQLYADFSGYMDIMCGFSKILDIELQENFRQPYFSETIEEFWKRWHTTLGNWFKDYIFYPISTGSLAQKIGRNVRKKYGPQLGKLIPGYFALIFVWTLTGLWHGADWAYVVWGWLNLLLIIMELQTKDFCGSLKVKLRIPSNSWWWRSFRIARTFLLICLLRLFSYGRGMTVAWNMLGSVFVGNYDILFQPGQWLPVKGGFMSKTDLLVLAIAVLVMATADIIQEKKIRIKVPMPVRTLGYALCIVMILYTIGAGSNLVGGFMYAQF